LSKNRHGLHYLNSQCVLSSMAEKEMTVAEAAAKRKVYPLQPSDRLLVARGKKSAGRERRWEAKDDPFEGLVRRHTAHVNRLHPVSSGACDFVRHDCDLRGQFSGFFADLPQPRGVPFDHAHRRVEYAGNDLFSDELPRHSDAFVAAATDCLRAGCLPLVDALTERQTSSLGGSPSALNAAYDMTSWAPATARVVRKKEHLPSRLHSDPVSVKPTRKPQSLAWAGCTRGAMLVYSNTTVLRQPDKVVPLAAMHFDAENCAELDELDVVKVPVPMRMRQNWPQALAIGPANSLREKISEGLYFETHVEVTSVASKEIQSRGQRGTEGGQVPQMHFGVTSVAPPEDYWESVVLEDPYISGGSCWTISTSGYVYADGAFQCSVPVDWAAPSGIAPWPARPKARRRVGLLVTEWGGLRLFVDDRLTASSPPGIVPRALGWGVGSLFPLVALGPNIWRVTLLPHDEMEQ